MPQPPGEVSFVHVTDEAMGWGRCDRRGLFSFRELDPRVKLVAGFIFLALIVSLHSPAGLGIMLLVVCFLAWRNGISWSYLGRRLLVALPFVGLILIFLPFTYPGEQALVTVAGLVVTLEGVRAAGIAVLRVAGAVGFASVLMACTSERELWLGMQGLHVPPVFTQLFVFTLRYLRVLAYDLHSLQLACAARGFRPGTSLAHRQTFHLLGEVLGAFLVRSMRRAEVVYLALLSRGFDGEATAGQLQHLRVGDWLPGGLLAGLGLALFLVDRGLPF